MRDGALLLIGVIFGAWICACGATSSGDGPTPACSPRAPVRAGGFYDHAALPTGVCTIEPDCSLGVIDCPWGEHPVNAYRCTCAGGTWSCRIEFAGGSLCSDGGSFDAADGSDADADAAADAPADAPCAYPPTNNDALCPTTYSFALFNEACPSIGLTCAYPGSGDQTPDGCFATAMMWCRGDGGNGTPGTWTVAQ